MPLASGDWLGLAAAFGSEDYVSRKVIRKAAQAVVRPSSHARTTGNDGPRIHERVSGVVVDLFGIHGANHGDVVGDTSDVWKPVGDLHAAFSISGEWEGGAFDFELGALELGDLLSRGEGLGHRFAVTFFQGRFVVERFQVGGPSCHAQMDDALDLRGVVQSFETSGDVALAANRIGTQEVS